MVKGRLEGGKLVVEVDVDLLKQIDPTAVAVGQILSKRVCRSCNGTGRFSPPAGGETVSCRSCAGTGVFVILSPLGEVSLPKGWCAAPAPAPLGEGAVAEAIEGARKGAKKK